MDQLINDSLNLVKIDDNLNLMYDWMDYGDVLNNKIRLKTVLSQIELEFIKTYKYYKKSYSERKCIPLSWSKYGSYKTYPFKCRTI